MTAAEPKEAADQRPGFRKMSPRDEEAAVHVSMVRRNMENIAQFPLPDGVRVRWYRVGDESLWLQVQKAADMYNPISRELFHDQFPMEPRLLAERQVFLVDGLNNPLATATAWFDDDFHGQAYGRVHWVAVIPQMQRRGLGKALLTIVCNRLRELGYQRAYLTTLSLRLAALNLYLHFGFEPFIQTSGEQKVWESLDKKLRRAPF